MPKRTLPAHQWLAWATLCSVILSAVLATGLAAPAPLHAQDSPTPVHGSSSKPVSVAVQGSDTIIDLSLPMLGGAANAAAAQRSLPMTRFGGYYLPLQLVTLQYPAGADPVLDLQGIEAAELAAPPALAAPETPPALDWEPAPGLASQTPSLPAAPAFVVRSGMLRGRHVAVVAVSPIYQENGVAKLASRLRVVAPGAAPVQGELLQEVLTPAAAGETEAAEAVNVPLNTAAFADGYRITVAQPGMQEVPYSQLGLAGAPAGVKLEANGQEVAVEMAPDRLRFYAPAAGDRWNATSAYWLTLEAGTKVIGTRGAVAPGPSKGAYEEGKWQDNRLYEAGYRGADGDHWFHTKLAAEAVLPLNRDVTQSVPVTVTAQTALPLRDGTSVFSVIATDVTGQAVCNQTLQYHVQGTRGGSVIETQVVRWLPSASCDAPPTSTAAISTSQPIDGMLLRLNPNGVVNTAVLLEAVSWRRPVELDFQAAAGGAEFVTDGGAGSYALGSLPASWQLYDVTEPGAPVVVAAGSGGSYTLNQAAAAPASRYYLANLAAVRQPAVQAHAPTVLGDVRGADAIYIGPAQFADELAPLLALRQQQGFQPLFVDVQAVYDVYGFGQISAAAIRNFLRDRSDWQNTARRISVVLVGDATVDPFAYGGVANAQLVAPWMDEVDPWARGIGADFGEAACDACIAQLHGENPLTGDNLDANRQWFAADIWIGRFPVRSEQETADLAAKLVAYDTAPEAEAWRARSIFLADNYIKKLDEQKNAEIDPAGDFAALSDNIVRMLPANTSARRIYFDPAPSREVVLDTDSGSYLPVGVPNTPGYYLTQPRRVAETWRISDVVVNTGSATVNLPINSLVIGALSGGAGLVAYNGHSHHWQFAVTEDREGAPDPKWLLNINDVRLLANQNKPFVMLSMTCYTSQFVKPANNGTLDEVLLRARNAGAVAAWGPTGLSVVSGHELLQQGFLKQQQKQPAGSQRLGALVEAGYSAVLAGAADLDPLMTFVLLGDPLTRARFGAAALYLPAVGR